MSENWHSIRVGKDCENSLHILPGKMEQCRRQESEKRTPHPEVSLGGSMDLLERIEHRSTSRGKKNENEMNDLSLIRKSKSKLTPKKYPEVESAMTSNGIFVHVGVTR